MKIHLLTALLLSGAAAVAQITNPAPYCAGRYDDGQGFSLHYISNVTLGTLNNSTTADVTALPHYHYYNNVAAPTLRHGQSYRISVSHDPANSSLHYAVAFIDFNHDLHWDSTEIIMVQSEIYNVVQQPSATSFTVPANAVAGTTRMRVMVFEDDNYTFPVTGATPHKPISCTNDATGYFDTGETEDYNVIIAITTGISNELTPVVTHFAPNPATGIVTLCDNAAIKTITIVDAQGRVALSVNEPRQMLDVSMLAPGLYVALLQNKNGAINKERLAISK